MLERRTGKVAAKSFTAASVTTPNLLHNGAFQVAQRGVGPHTAAAYSATNVQNNDDVYMLDRWILLSNGNDIVDVSQDTTDLPSGGSSCLMLDVETANAKFGIVQIVESKDTIALRSQSLSLSFKAKVTGSSIANLRAAVIAWDGTADSVTSDVVSAWAVAGTNPTLVANCTYENTATDLAVSTTWTTFKIEAISFDTASANNAIVFIWVDDTDATVADVVRITDVRLEVGVYASEYVRRPYAEELRLCQRFFIGSRGATTPRIYAGSGWNSSATDSKAIWHLPVQMRIGPTVTFSTGTDWNVFHAATSTACNTITGTAGADAMSIYVATETGGGLTTGQGSSVQSDAGTAPYVDITAEL